MPAMAGDFLIRKLPDDLKQRLKQRAERNGRSLSAEARDILEETLAGEPREAKPGEGWATSIARRFDGLGVDLWPAIQELREQSVPDPRYTLFEVEDGTGDGK